MPIRVSLPAARSPPCLHVDLSTVIERDRRCTNSYKMESFFFKVGSDGIVTASATNEVGFSRSGGFPLGIGLYGDVFLRTCKAGRRDCGTHLLCHGVVRCYLAGYLWYLWTLHQQSPDWQGKQHMQTSSSVNNYNSKSISSNDQHVIMHTKIGWRKAKPCRFGSGK
jgi:hypothetical protein